MVTTKASNLLKTITLCFFIFSWTHTNICAAESLISAFRLKRNKLISQVIADRINLDEIGFYPYLLAPDIETRTQYAVLLAVIFNEPKKALALVHAYAICKTMHENSLRLQRILGIKILNNNFQLQKPINAIDAIGKHYRQTSNNPRKELQTLFGVEEGVLVWEITQPQGNLAAFRESMTLVELDRQEQSFMRDLALDFLENTPQSPIPTGDKAVELPPPPSVPKPQLNPSEYK